MDLLKYINGVLFIDDNREDVGKLYSYFDKYNVPCMYINPNEYNGEISNTIGFARFVFLDIEYMNGTPNLTNVVSLLRDLSEKGMENVALIMWTLHDNYVDELIELINKKMGKSKPILMFNARKSNFLELEDDKFNQQLENLISEKIEAESLFFKMLEWEKSSNVATYKTFNDIIQMSYNDENGCFEIENTLSNMASQNIPNNMISSSFDTANTMLIDKIKFEVEHIENVELPMHEDKEFLRKMNYYMMFFTNGLEKIHPGNIYLKDELNGKFKETIDASDILVEKVEPIHIDITPGCSFAHSNNIILLNGIIIKDINDDDKKAINKIFDSKAYLKDIYISDDDKMNYFIVDFLNVVSSRKEDIESEPIMCLKGNYRISIQQQFGNYLGRIGDNIYHGIK